MQLSDEQLKSLQQAQLRLAMEFRRVCDENNIEYFMMAGTLLGAVRHQGFIPWDDDMDLGMVRRDFDKLLACADSTLGKDFHLQIWGLPGGLGLPYAKLRLNGTRFVESVSADTGSHQGIFIDIFPFDNVPDALFLRMLQKTSAYLLKRIVAIRSGIDMSANGSALKKLAYRCLTVLSSYVSTTRAISLLDKEMKRYNRRPTTKMTAFGGSYGYSKESIEASWTEDLINLRFEDCDFLAVRNYDDYLRNLYGEYLTLPPVEQRKSRHHLIDFSL